MLRRRSQPVSGRGPGPAWGQMVGEASPRSPRPGLFAHTEQLSFYTYVGESLRNVFGGFEKMGSVTHLRQSWAGSRAP